MTVRITAISFESRRPRESGDFWASVLGRSVLEEPGVVVVPENGAELGLRFIPASTPRSVRNWLHLHVGTSSDAEQRAIVEDALRRGGESQGTHPLPFGRDLYLNDPNGDEFCVIESTNTYLAGCGRLAEVTCDGTVANGRFWAEVLGWRVVWDQEGQLAIQSPAGGTKIGWDVWDESTREARDRQEFVLEASEFEADRDRLVRLGAILQSQDDRGAVLTDPDGRRFSVFAPAA